MALGQLTDLAQWRMYDLLDWRRVIELMLRRLILLEALAIAPALPGPRIEAARPAPTALQAGRSRALGELDRPLPQLATGKVRRRVPLSAPAAAPRREGSFSKHLASRDRADLRGAWALPRRRNSACRPPRGRTRHDPRNKETSRSRSAARGIASRCPPHSKRALKTQQKPSPHGHYPEDILLSLEFRPNRPVPCRVLELSPPVHRASVYGFWGGRVVRDLSDA